MVIEIKILGGPLKVQVNWTAQWSSYSITIFSQLNDSISVKPSWFNENWMPSSMPLVCRWKRDKDSFFKFRSQKLLGIMSIKLPLD